MWKADWVETRDLSKGIEYLKWAQERSGLAVDQEEMEWRIEKKGKTKEICFHQRTRPGIDRAYWWGDEDTNSFYESHHNR